MCLLCVTTAVALICCVLCVHICCVLCVRDVLIYCVLCVYAVLIWYCVVCVVYLLCVEYSCCCINLLCVVCVLCVHDVLICCVLCVFAECYYCCWCWFNKSHTCNWFQFYLCLKFIIITTCVFTWILLVLVFLVIFLLVIFSWFLLVISKIDYVCFLHEFHLCLLLFLPIPDVKLQCKFTSGLWPNISNSTY